MKKFLFVLFVLLSGNVMADNEICGDAYYYRAEFEPIVYNCDVNQFLPAGAISCEECPVNHTCPGGIYTFNAVQTQGLDDGDILVMDAIGSCSSKFNQSFVAIFDPITYTCAAGYYLPAGNDWLTDDQGCTICPADNYCVGGTYVFSAAENQGITQCPENRPFAPIGMWQSNQCGRKLHIGDDVVYLKGTKTTKPSLNVGMDDGIFYANMTTTPTRMNAGTEHYLKIEYDNTIYYVCDDTTYGK